ncbi:MAG: tRNA pseudouridine(38-40) synthase TruA [Acidimicrobiales bacterium]
MKGVVSLFSADAGPDFPAAVRSGPVVRLALTLAYAGAGFHGFAAQRGQRTVAGVLAAAAERHLRHTVEITCAGRTDAGVHAWGQVVSFDARADVDPGALARAVNRALGPEVVVRSAVVAADGFDARRSATGRRYRYDVLNAAVGDPFLAPTSWLVSAPLDLRAMRLACDPLVGEHDFSSFCRRPPGQGSLVRAVRHAGWSPAPGTAGLLRFEIEASSFCHQMVRALVGTLVEVGLGRRRAGEMAGILRAAERSAAGRLAPPQGLCLWEVTYRDGGGPPRISHPAGLPGPEGRPRSGVGTPRLAAKPSGDEEHGGPSDDDRPEPEGDQPDPEQDPRSADQDGDTEGAEGVVADDEAIPESAETPERLDQPRHYSSAPIASRGLGPSIPCRAARARPMVSPR